MTAVCVIARSKATWQSPGKALRRALKHKNVSTRFFACGSEWQSGAPHKGISRLLSRWRRYANKKIAYTHAIFLPLLIFWPKNHPDQPKTASAENHKKVNNSAINSWYFRALSRWAWLINDIYGFFILSFKVFCFCSAMNTHHCLIINRFAAFLTIHILPPRHKYTSYKSKKSSIFLTFVR